MEKYQIFISYRRDGGDALAGRLADRFNALGYKVFYDVESMRSGTFNTQILDAVAQCDDVLLVLPANALDRCVNADDWVRQELAFAIKHNKNIIPIMMRGFEFPASLPADIDKIRYMEGVTASSEYFDAVVQRIETLLISHPIKEQGKTVCVDDIKLPFFLRTPLSVLPSAMIDYGLNKKLVEAKRHFDTLKGCSSVQEFCRNYNNLEKDSYPHDFELEFACFTDPDKNVPLALKKYYKTYYKTDILPDGFVEQHKSVILQLGRIVENLIKLKPPYYEVILLEYLGIFFEMEYYYRNDAYDSLYCVNAIFSYVFQCYPIGLFREDFYKMKTNSKMNLMQHVSFTLQNIKNDNEGTLQLLEFLFVLQTYMLVFAPRKDKIKCIRTYLLINYKYLKKNNILNDVMKEAFWKTLKDIDKVKNIDY